jgi:hypothetical protein
VSASSAAASDSETGIASIKNAATLISNTEERISPSTLDKLAISQRGSKAKHASDHIL